MYIIYNNDGSVKTTNFAEFIQRGNNEVNHIFVGNVANNIRNYNVYALFKLPNGDIGGPVNGVEAEEEIYGETYQGLSIPITEEATLYPGIVKMTLHIANQNNEVLYTYPVILTINDTSVVPPDLVRINLEQYQDLLNLINQVNQNKSNATNVENGSGTNSVQMKQDGTSGTFDFTNKNLNATTADPTLTSNITYGGTGDFATVFGGKAAAIGKRSLAQGTTTIAKGNYSHAEGDNSVALGNDSHAEGYATLSQGRVSHSEGNATISQGAYSHAEGIQTKAIGEESHSEGLRTEAGGLASHSEGIDTKSAAIGSHSEGSNTQIKIAIPSGGGGGGGEDTPLPDPTWSADDHIGEYAHTEGGSTIVYGYCAHAEGFGNVAFGHYSHAEGWHTTAGKVDSTNNKLLGYGAHAEGRETKALADYSHTEGYHTIANYNYQTVVGTFNQNKSNTLFEVGNGANGNVSNAFEVYKDGHAEVRLMGTTNKSVATKEYVDNNSGGTKLYRHRMSVSLDASTPIKLTIINNKSTNYGSITSPSNFNKIFVDVIKVTAPIGGDFDYWQTDIEVYLSAGSASLSLSYRTSNNNWVLLLASNPNVRSIAIEDSVVAL